MRQTWSGCFPGSTLDRWIPWSGRAQTTVVAMQRSWRRRTRSWLRLGWAMGIARRRRRSHGGGYEEHYRKGQRGSARKLGVGALWRSRRLLSGANYPRRDNTLVARSSGTESMGRRSCGGQGFGYPFFCGFVFWMCRYVPGVKTGHKDK
ncbi:uncharacterized protein M6B38_351550 [Iris pallida]|uniref:Uncharacterized protein n=1 Tax=Iris pallida TaxID=29817 RepID=A0AAX6GRU1_IRIPA|nr:uncharacterized protein M6B38_351550 [Iris pallida]